MLFNIAYIPLIISGLIVQFVSRGISNWGLFRRFMFLFKFNRWGVSISRIYFM